MQERKCARRWLHYLVKRIAYVSSTSCSASFGYTFRLVLSLYIRHFDDVAGGNRSSPPTPAQRRRRRVTVVVVEMERMPREEINARPARL